jgi:IS605 OrfB family transposase
MQTGVVKEGERFARHLWDKISNLNNDIAHRTSREIVDFAKYHGAKIIVFEHLDGLKPSKGTKSHWLNQRFIFWVSGSLMYS